MNITEKNFLRQLRRRNENALEFVVRNYGGMMKAIIQRILYAYPEDAEECLYDCILKIWEHIDSFDQSKSTFSGWSASIARYTALDRLRKLKKLEPITDIDSIPIASPEQITGDKLFDEFFMELISCLNERDKKLFIRIFWNGESIAEVAESSGTPKSALYNRISRGKKKIISANPDYFRKEE